jgi:hypothetical protein
MGHEIERTIVDLGINVNYEPPYYMEGQILREPGRECVVPSPETSSIRSEELEHLKRFSERALDFV